MGEDVVRSDGGYLVLGQQVDMPVQVRAARQASASFLVRHSAAQRVIEHTGLTASRYPGGRSMVSLAIVDYLDNDLGCYKELALAFMVDDPQPADGAKRGQPVSTLIHRLPVTEEFTCAAGRGIWGFPKWITDVDVAFTPKRATCVLRESGSEVLRLEIARGPIPVPRRPLPMNAFSCDDDLVVRRTPWTTDGTGRQHLGLGVLGGRAQLEVGYGHPLADELRALGLPKRPVMCMFDEHMSATFGEPEIVPSAMMRR